MTHKFIFLLKPFSFLPALAMMYIIYGFSAQNGEESGNLSFEVSCRIVEMGNTAFDQGLNDRQIQEYAGQISHPVRKLAHMTEYFLLTLDVSFPLYVYGLRGLPLILAAGLFCVGFAAGDEYHQSFVDGRGPSKRDVIIDSIGVCAGLITVKIICRLRPAPSPSS